MSFEKQLGDIVINGNTYTDTWIEEQLYDDGQIYVSIENPEGCVTTASVNLSDYGLVPDPGAFFLKNYSENTGLYEALIGKGVIEPAVADDKIIFGPFNTEARHVRLVKE